MSSSSPNHHKILPFEETISSLPPENKSSIRAQIHSTLNNASAPKLVILDDDPTGTQTCHDIAVLTVWDIPTLKTEFLTSHRGFFILTNSRAFPPQEARLLLREICENLKTAAAAANKPFEIVLRGDSTLRGHFPLEPEVVEEVFGEADAWILAPFFYQGGRYTIDDIHYVLENNMLVPAGQTPFARDASFGYCSSNLRDYIQEKAPGKFNPENVVSITLDDIRQGGASKVKQKLLSLAPRSIVVVNAAAESDMDIFSAGLLAAEQSGKKFLFRTAAAFVSSRLGIIPKPPMTAQELDLDYGRNTHGGLIVAGSYVPKTTAQLNTLIARRGDKLKVVELNVSALISKDTIGNLIHETADAASAEIGAGNDVLIMTSRDVITGHDAVSSLDIGGVVAAALVEIVKRVSKRPRYIIAKGGITSSDTATKALGIKRAMVLGQAAPGVPLWRCDELESRHPGMPFVVFPGNVGGDEALVGIVEGWALDGGSE